MESRTNNLSTSNDPEHVLPWLEGLPTHQVLDLEWKALAALARTPGALQQLLCLFTVVCVRDGADRVRGQGLVGVPGLDALPQYEAVRAGAIDPTKFETVARSAGDGLTSASKPKNTLIHQDGYQFVSPYRGVSIAGIHHMPDVELLAFPVVEETRTLEFFHLGWAARALSESPNGHEHLEALMQPKFEIAGDYRANDHYLDDPGRFPVLHRQDRGWRFQLGGSVVGVDPMAQHALDLFRGDAHRFMRRTAVTPGLLVLINQRVMAHRGVRLAGVDGQTVLFRQLFRWNG